MNYRIYRLSSDLDYDTVRRMFRVYEKDRHEKSYNLRLRALVFFKCGIQGLIWSDDFSLKHRGSIVIEMCHDGRYNIEMIDLDPETIDHCYLCQAIPF